MRSLRSNLLEIIVNENSRGNYWILGLGLPVTSSSILYNFKKYYNPATALFMVCF